MKRPTRPRVSLLLGLPLVLLAGLALASESGDARSRAEAALGSLQASPARAKLAKSSIDPARHALRRASDARAAGDHVHAAALESLALEHATSGVDLVRAVDAERELANTQRELSEVETKVTRARALLEETLARRGRARAKLDELEKPQAPSAAPEGSKPTPKPAGSKP